MVNRVKVHGFFSVLVLRQNIHLIELFPKMNILNIYTSAYNNLAES